MTPRRYYKKYLTLFLDSAKPYFNLCYVWRAECLRIYSVFSVTKLLILLLIKTISLPGGKFLRISSWDLYFVKTNFWVKSHEEAISIYVCSGVMMLKYIYLDMVPYLYPSKFITGCFFFFDSYFGLWEGVWKVFCCSA